MELHKRRDALWGQFIANLGYAPLTIHWCVLLFLVFWSCWSLSRVEQRFLVLLLFARVCDLRRQWHNLLVMCLALCGFSDFVIHVSSMRVISMDRVLARHNAPRRKWWKCIVRVWSHTIPRSCDIAGEGCVDCTRTEGTRNRCRGSQAFCRERWLPNAELCGWGGAVR